MPNADIPSCALCNLFLAVCKDHKVEPGTSVQFVRRGSTLEIAGQGMKLPVLSILGEPGAIHDPSIQIGIPPEPVFDDGILPNLLNSWVLNCNDHHEKCCTVPSGELPTRLIEVGPERTSRIRLVRTKEQNLDSSTSYVALSHPWGDTDKFPPFCTYLTNRNGDGHDEASFLKGIDYNKLPATFRDAIDISRLLGVNYLWIDSICILQGDDGDFTTEASRMETVFSGAYCVIAANAAHHQNDGFLKKRVSRDYVRFTSKDGRQAPLYICNGVDDFSRDVLGSHLNSRGWVLQERALARRTIFFTETQAYFECGEGIHCETFTKKKNSTVGMLGDPHFPDKVLNDSKAQKIVYFQELFRHYSKLKFSKDYDRPIGISGLEARLQQRYESNGKFGVFGSGVNGAGGFFRYSLLWKREDEKKHLTRIDFSLSKVQHVPTWSWMGYKGPIDYLKVPLGEVDWELADIQPPWPASPGAPNGTHTIPDFVDDAVALELSAPTWAYDVSAQRLHQRSTGRRTSDASKPVETHKVYFDLDPSLDSTPRKYRCIILGKKRSSGSDDDKEHFVLIVTMKDADQATLFERVGVASMLGYQIKFEEGSTPGKVV